MSHEIYYTSAPEGIKRGSSGFSTVAATDAIPKALIDRLETLSAYRHHFGVAEGQGANGQNPVSFAHWLLNVTGTTYHVLSRVCDSGVDHTHRSNAFAHHLVVEAADMAAGGPAWMLEYPGVMETTWDGRVGAIARTEMLPQASAGGDVRGGVCRRWGAVTGDPGWGGVLADLFVKNPAKPVCILFSLGQEVLPLLEETIALLPPAARWNVTFNTYFTSMPTSATCVWRCCLAGTPASQIALRYAASGLVIDLTDPARLGEIPEGPYVAYARTGQPPPSARPAVTARPAVGAAPKPTAAAPPSAPPLDAGDDDDEDRPFDFANADDDALQNAAADPALDRLAAGATPVRSRPLVRKRIVPIIRNADHILRTAEGDAARAAARRRRQVMILFFSALGAIALGMVIVMIALRDNTSTELPPVPRKTAVIPPAAETSPLVLPLPAPEPPAPSPLPPRPATVTNTNTVVVPSPAAPVTPVAQTAPPVQIISRYPRILTLPALMDQPVSGQGIADYSQTIAIPANLLDPAARIAAMHFNFPPTADPANSPPSRPGSPAVFPYREGVTGALIATPGRSLGLPTVTLSWKDPASSDDILDIALNAAGGRPPELHFTWKASALLKHPDIVKLVYWLVQSSTLALEAPGDQANAGQQIAFKPFQPAAFRLTDASTAFLLPSPLPPDATVLAPAAAALPAGWSATEYTDWVEPDTALRTAANAWQVVKFRKSTNVAAADAWFLIRFAPGMTVIESTYAKQAADALSHIADSESDLRAINAQIDAAKKANDGILPNTDSAKRLVEKQTDAVAFVEAYKAAVAGYNDVRKFDIPLALPDGVRLGTLKFQRDN